MAAWSMTLALGGGARVLEDLLLAGRLAK